ncbi:tetratricopeptide repeat protein [Streptomyces sp. TRM43335]|uniref:Tetratricopeptide repeat protein n=1 Tax=Streptomyces taklimakanensis TaxID=2569853 RepID=A0A6G2BA84_9ACTN|nr:tetratricopeptide repeat protein [Streptomyces taklimakanensis]MTE19177.1 tetratricopeptide repeat protein [Streptomyces taklimakanensis]
MASSPSPSAPAGPDRQPNLAFRRLRGRLSPGEFAAAVRRAGREIGERVSCDARYVGRVEAGEIRCPNYAYERVFLHMFPGYSLTDLGFEPRQAVRGRTARGRGAYGGGDAPRGARVRPVPTRTEHPSGTPGPSDEESDVLRRAFMTGGPAAMAAMSLGPTPFPDQAAARDTSTGAPAGPGAPGARPVLAGRPGEAEAEAVEETVRHIRLLDDRHGADDIYRQAGEALRAAYGLLDAGARRQSIVDRLHTGAGELAISVGWLAHDSGRLAEARPHYAEALATARVAGDPALEAHAFCNTSFLARDAGRPREAVRAAQAGQHVAEHLGSPRLLSLLAAREAGGWAGLADRSACEESIGRARTLFERGPSDADPEWMSFYGEAELNGLEAQCWAALGDWGRAARRARRAVVLQGPHFVRNTALFTAELADDLAGHGDVAGAAEAGCRALDLLDRVRSSRVLSMLDGTARRLRHHRGVPAVADFLDRRAESVRPARPA